MDDAPTINVGQSDYTVLQDEVDDRRDFMNLRSTRTGVDGTIFISTREPAHGPRMKLYAGRPGASEPSVVLSIEEDPRRLEPASPSRELQRLEPQAMAWVKLNRAALLRFWNEGVDWFKDEVDAFEASLKPLPR